MPGKIAANPDPMPTPLLPPPTVRQDRRPLVLVADDDRVTSQIIEGALAQIGFRARIAHDGQSALQAIREYHPDLILLDVSLPDASGIEICRNLQTEPGLARCRSSSFPGMKSWRSKSRASMPERWTTSPSRWRCGR